MIAILIALEFNEIEADRDLDFHCPDTVRSMIQDGCRHLQHVLKQRAAEARKKKLEQQQRQHASERSKRSYNDVMDHLIAAQNETDLNNIDDSINDDDANSNFSVEFLENERKYINLSRTCICSMKTALRLLGKTINSSWLFKFISPKKSNNNK